MFPTPATLRWSSRNALIGARLARVSAYRCALVNSGAERLDPEPRGEERVARVAAERQLAGAEAARVVEDQLAPVVEREAHARGGAAAPAGPAAASRSCADGASGGRRPRAPRSGTCRAAPSASTRRPSTAAATSVAGERPAPALVEDLERAQLAALDVGREVAADRLDLGQLRHPRRAWQVSRWPPGARRATARASRRITRSVVRAPGRPGSPRR